MPTRDTTVMGKIINKIMEPGFIAGKTGAAPGIDMPAGTR